MMPTGLWRRTRAAAPQRTGTRAGATCRAVPIATNATADWNQTWCYVQGGSNCDQALDSTVAGETRKWLECSPSTPSPTPAPDIESASGVGEPTMTAAIIAVILSTACA
ncbi:unnamed protein product [Prorocentrum cordatum]|uniref:Uncharacterized protein n=1 Tax=Prorocentrum cordatum TaxID=2364126 RepID=A0ABN9XL22_9DINO|nr:unnamed protein product [Polarella glacialis]